MPELIRRRTKTEIITRDAKGSFASAKEKECKRCRAVKPITNFPIKASKNNHKWYGPFCEDCLELLTRRVCTCGCGGLLPKTGGYHYLAGHDPTVLRERPAPRAKTANSWQQRNPDKCFGYKLKHLFGITIDIYNAYLAKQGGRCGICRTDTPGGRYRYWCVDHDHVTGAIRGLLCLRCNSGIGALGDSAEGVRRALNYLTSSNTVL